MPGYNNWVTIIKSETTSLYKFDFSSIQTMNKTQSFDYTIEKIYENYGENIYVYLRGGPSSESIANSLKRNGKQFKVVILDYVVNRLEIWYAYKWCYENNITPEVIQFSKDEFGNKIIETSNKYQCPVHSVMDFMVKEYVEEKNGKLLTGAGEPFSLTAFYPNSTLNESIPEDLKSNTKYYNFHDVTNNLHPYTFMLYTPEIFSNIIKEMRHDIPQDIALSQYYEVNARPVLRFSQYWPIYYPDTVIDSFKQTSELYESSYSKEIALNRQELLAAIDSRSEYIAFV